MTSLPTEQDALSRRAILAGGALAVPLSVLAAASPTYAETTASNLAVNARDFGAVGDGRTDDTAALQAWLAAPGTEFYLPAGTYLTTKTLVQRFGTSVALAQTAILKASARMDVLWTTENLNNVPESDGKPAKSGFITDKYLTGGIFECNDLADEGIRLPGFKRFTLTNLCVRNFNVAGIHAGTNKTHTSFELITTNVHTDRDSGSRTPPNSRGIWIENSSDHELNSSIVVGADIGVDASCGNTNFTNVHVWAYSPALHSVSFSDNNRGNSYVNCTSDTPTVAGFQLNWDSTRLIGCKVFNNDKGTDNQVDAVWLAQPGNRVQILGCFFLGSSGHTLRSDVAGPGLDTPSIGTSLVGGGFVAVGNATGLVQNVNIGAGKMSTTSAHVGRLHVTYNDTLDKTVDPVLLRVDDTSGDPYVHMRRDWKKLSLSRDFGLSLYAGTMQTETVRLTSDGGVVPGTPAGAGSVLHSGTGVPAFTPKTPVAFYFRSDGAAGTTIYKYASGQWKALL